MSAHLPGQSVSIHDDEWGTFCYTHHDIKATHRICSEADSFVPNITTCVINAGMSIEQRFKPKKKILSNGNAVGNAEIMFLI